MPGSGESECEAALELEKLFLISPGPSERGNIVIGRFFCADNCGGSDYALTCWRPIRNGPDQGKVKIGVCIPKGHGRSACEIRALIAHELQHVNDLIELANGKSGSAILDDFNNLDKTAFEAAAYRVQCSEYASQRCIKAPERDSWIGGCVDALLPLRTGKIGVGIISGGCDAIDF